MVHKQKKKKELEELPSADDDTFYPVSKESTMLSFCMEMRREEENEVEEESEKVCPEVDDAQGESEENGEKRDMLIVTMTKTNISIVAGRGCSSESSCQGCDGGGCNYNDVVIVSESSTVTLGEYVLVSSPLLSSPLLSSPLLSSPLLLSATCCMFLLDFIRLLILMHIGTWILIIE